MRVDVDALSDPPPEVLAQLPRTVAFQPANVSAPEKLTHLQPEHLKQYNYQNKQW